MNYHPRLGLQAFEDGGSGPKSCAVNTRWRGLGPNALLITVEMQFAERQLRTRKLQERLT